MKRITATVFTLIGFLHFPLSVLAGDGDLDDTFGDGKGFVTFQSSPGSVRNYQDIPSATLQQSDGKLVTVGGDGHDWGLLEISRLNADGTLDTTFNNSGLQVFPSAVGHAAMGAIMLPNDQVLVAALGNDADFEAPLLLRMNADGTLDSTFGVGGSVNLPRLMYTSHYMVNDPLPLANGKYAVIEVMTDGWGNTVHSGVVQLNVDGSLDTTFGTDGLSAELGIIANYGKRMTQQADGKLLVVGNAFAGLKVIVSRLNTDGTLDTTFNGTGSYQSALDTAYDEQIAVQDDGHILVFLDGNTLRLNANGSVDTTFGTNGVRTEPVSGIPLVKKDASGNLIALYYSPYSAFPAIHGYVVRYLPDGSRDNVLNLDFPDAYGDSSGHGASLLIQADGQYVVSINLLNEANNTQDTYVYRYASDGTADTGFATNGVARINFRGLDINGAAAYTALQQTDGKIITAGWLYDFDSTKQFGLVRYNSNGTLDTTFNNTGSVVTTLEAHSNYGVWLRDLIQQKDGKLVAAGYTQGGIALARYNLDGSLDTTFNGSGKIVQSDLPPGIGVGLTAYSVLQQSDGRLVVGGYTYSEASANYQFLLARFNADGTADNAFGVAGFATVDGALLNGGVNSVMQQDDGKLVAVGYSFISSPRGFEVARFNVDGSLDTTFNHSGTVLTSVDVDFGGEAQRVLQQTNGKILVAGSYGLARYNKDGLLDDMFGQHGTVNEHTLLGYPAEVKYLQIQGNKIIVIARNGSTIIMLRYNLDGSADRAFGNAGVLLINNLGQGNNVSDVNAAVLQMDGKLLAAGVAAMTSTPSTVEQMFVSRFNLAPVSDLDKDGVADAVDNCPKKYNPGQADMDGDGIGDACDTDIDGDGIPNWRDKYPMNAALAGDPDHDGIDTLVDNCPNRYNPDQLDLDHDGKGNVCDPDRDGDGIANVRDHFPDNPLLH